MRTFALGCLIGLLVALCAAFAVGLITVSTEHPQGRYLVTFTVHTDMVLLATRVDNERISDDALVDIKGRITAVRSQKNELVVAEGAQEWTFRLTKESKITLNNREVPLSDLRAGDDANVTFERKGQEMLATLVRSTRNK